MKITLYLFALILSVSSYAQNECDTEDVDSSTMTVLPWFGNNDWLSNFVDSIETPFNCTNCRIGDGPTKTLYQIPINAVVYDDINFPNISNDQVERYINYVNNIYNEILSSVYCHLYILLLYKGLCSEFIPICFITDVKHQYSKNQNDQ